MKKLIIFALIATVGMNFSCSDSFFDIQPQCAASLTSLSNKNGVNALLIGAYSLLDGVGAGNTGRQSTISNYVFGGITSGDAVKGTDAGDQPEQSYIEQYNWLSDNTYFLGKWQHTYDGVARANEAILLAKSADVKDMTEAEKTTKKELMEIRNELNILKIAKTLSGDFYDNVKVDDKGKYYFESDGKRMNIKFCYKTEYFN